MIKVLTACTLITFSTLILSIEARSASFQTKEQCRIYYWDKWQNCTESYQRKVQKWSQCRRDWFSGYNKGGYTCGDEPPHNCPFTPDQWLTQCDSIPSAQDVSLSGKSPPKRLPSSTSSSTKPSKRKEALRQIAIQTAAGILSVLLANILTDILTSPSIETDEDESNITGLSSESQESSSQNRNLNLSGESSMLVDLEELNSEVETTLVAKEEINAINAALRQMGRPEILQLTLNEFNSEELESIKMTRKVLEAELEDYRRAEYWNEHKRLSSLMNAQGKELPKNYTWDEISKTNISEVDFKRLKESVRLEEQEYHNKLEEWDNYVVMRKDLKNKVAELPPLLKKDEFLKQPLEKIVKNNEYLYERQARCWYDCEATWYKMKSAFQLQGKKYAFSRRVLKYDPSLSPPSSPDLSIMTSANERKMAQKEFEEKKTAYAYFINKKQKIQQKYDKKRKAEMVKLIKALSPGKVKFLDKEVAGEGEPYFMKYQAAVIKSQQRGALQPTVKELTEVPKYEEEFIGATHSIFIEEREQIQKFEREYLNAIK